jgi:predicted nucleotide-binding protein
MDRPKVFVGSSREDLEVAEIVQAELDKVGTVRIWDQREFDPGVFPLERLKEMVNEYDFAIFVIGASDIADVRGKKVLLARDNVIFEAGLFFGQLDPKRVFCLSQISRHQTMSPLFTSQAICRV